MCSGMFRGVSVGESARKFFLWYFLWCDNWVLYWGFPQWFKLNFGCFLCVFGCLYLLLYCLLDFFYCILLLYIFDILWIHLSIGPQLWIEFHDAI